VIPFFYLSFSIVCELLQVRVGFIFESPNQRLEFLSSCCCSCVDFSDTLARCLMNYARGRELSVGSILVVIISRMTLLA
jgi:hypothetical protein